LRYSTYIHKRTEPRRHTVRMHAFAIIVCRLVMTLTFDRWPWKRFL